MLMKIMERLEGMGGGAEGGHEDLSATVLLDGLPSSDAKQGQMPRPVPGVRGKEGEVVLEVMSNWGHRASVGLCELELFDRKGLRLFPNLDSESPKPKFLVLDLRSKNRNSTVTFPISKDAALNPQSSILNLELGY
jgi:hypothetical protein